jgi:sporulation protein YlmC with PRC-barrel domain
MVRHQNIDQKEASLMDIPLNAKVSCSDGPCGQSHYLVIKPSNEEITHMVVGDDNSFSETEYLVPIDRILESTPESIRLNFSCEELSKMPIYKQEQFIQSDLKGTNGSFSMLWPYATPEANYIIIENEHISYDELTIRRGASVEATNGRVGRVDEFLINPIDDTITHIIMREGHLWGQKNITIPLNQIDRIEENRVWLKLDKQSIEALPAIPIHHGRVKE